MNKNIPLLIFIVAFSLRAMDKGGETSKASYNDYVAENASEFTEAEKSDCNFIKAIFRNTNQGLISYQVILENDDSVIVSMEDSKFSGCYARNKVVVPIFGAQFLFTTFSRFYYWKNQGMEEPDFLKEEEKVDWHKHHLPEGSVFLSKWDIANLQEALAMQG